MLFFISGELMKKTKIKGFMTTDVVTASPDDTIKDVVKKLAENDISGIPIIDGERNILGMISEKDILTALKTESRSLSLVFPSSHALGMTFEEAISYRELKEAMEELQNSKVEKIMNRDVISIDENITITETASIMINNNINRIPIVKNGKLVGIITRGDIINALSKVK